MLDFYVSLSSPLNIIVLVLLSSENVAEDTLSLKDAISAQKVRFNAIFGK